MANIYFQIAWTLNLRSMQISSRRASYTPQKYSRLLFNNFNIYPPRYSSFYPHKIQNLRNSQHRISTPRHFPILFIDNQPTSLLKKKKKIHSFVVAKQSSFPREIISCNLEEERGGCSNFQRTKSSAK